MRIFGTVQQANSRRLSSNPRKQVIISRTSATMQTETVTDETAISGTNKRQINEDKHSQSVHKHTTSMLDAPVKSATGV